MRMSYVLAVSTTWPPMAAGSGRAFKELVSGVEALVVLAPKADGVVEDEPYVQRVLRFSGRGGGPLKIYSILQHLEAVLAPAAWSIGSRRGRPGLVVSSQTLFSGVGALLLRLIWGIPYIVHAHGEEFTFALENDSLMRARYHLIKVVLDRAAAIVCNSRYTWRVLHSEYGVSQDRLHVIHPTVDIRERQVDHVRVHRLKQELVGASQLLLMVGRLAEERKGFDKAIEALPLILTRRPDVKLVIAGPGDPTFLRLLAQQVGVEGHVVFVGELERKQLMLLYAACDVFLLPTRTMPNGDTEGFGIVFLEANLMGKPVVGGRAGGTEDAVVDGQTGLLVDGYDIEQIADAAVRVLDDPVYAKLLGQQGKERVLREFDTRVHQQEFVDIANSILSSP
jgi:glycosyltransferase involved in cell wall biosynthesis